MGTRSSMQAGTPSAESIHPNTETESAAMLADEEWVLEKTHASIASQLNSQSARFHRERARARELTSTMVATRRDEDRSLLASDEAVSHALTTQHDDTVTTLETLKDRPYFARVILEEEDDTSGETKTIEYKIGYAANPDCRIVDWRKAPLSKLYYEYREGDEYCEQIQGRERMGQIALRNRLEIGKGVLTQVHCRYGTFTRSASGSWASASSGSNKNRDFSSLPEVLSLITPEQFRAITQEAGSAVLIQGVAGSGKTTVALHRLSWLLAKGNSDLTADDAVILTLGPSLREYVKSSLKSLEIPSVPVFSYREWCSVQLAPYLPDDLLSGNERLPVLTPTSMRAPAGVERVKRSMGLLRAIETRAEGVSEKGSAPLDPFEFLLKALSDPRLIKSLDESKLLNDEVIKEAYTRTAETITRGTLDRSDFSLLLRIVQLLKGASTALRRRSPYKHIVIDEVQDYSPVELATVLSSLTTQGTLTLVGDTAQRVEEGFPGWEKLRRWWTARSVESSFVRLQVSHRSTRQIVACAAHLGSVEPPNGGRTGDRPQWLKGNEGDEATGAAINWLRKITSLAPNGMIGVICFSSAAVREVHSLLSPSFGPMIRMGDDASFSFDEGIVVCEAYAAKGLEFFGVLVWNPISSALPKGDVGRHLLYIASTRAQEHLAFVTWGEQKCALSSVPDRLLERVDVTVEAGEEEETDLIPRASEDEE